MMNDLYIVLNLTLLIIDEWYNESLGQGAMPLMTRNFRELYDLRCQILHRLKLFRRIRVKGKANILNGILGRALAK